MTIENRVGPFWRISGKVGTQGSRCWRLLWQAPSSLWAGCNRVLDPHPQLTTLNRATATHAPTPGCGRWS